MRNSVYEQFAIVMEDSAELFTAKLNEQIRVLRRNNPKVSFHDSNPLCAYIRYTVDETVPESVAEASELEGVSFTCSQCPHFKPQPKDDGTEDRRCKYGDCQYAEMGRTFKTTRACDRLYELIREGSVKLCFAD